MQCNCKCNSLVNSFPSHHVSISTHTHAFRSILRIFIAQTTAVRDVKSACAASQILRSSGTVWRRQPFTAHISAHAPDKIVRRGGKGEMLWAHTYPTVSSRPRGRKVTYKHACQRYKHACCDTHARDCEGWKVGVVIRLPTVSAGFHVYTRACCYPLRVFYALHVSTPA
jgi:hypothetical protein